jgi:hypothetical protein
MPQECWEALPVYTGERQGEAIFCRDSDKVGVVYRWIGGIWWQATLSFIPTAPPR